MTGDALTVLKRQIRLLESGKIDFGGNLTPIQQLCYEFEVMSKHDRTRFKRARLELLALRDSASAADRTYIDFVLTDRKYGVHYFHKKKGMTPKGSQGREIARRFYEVVNELKAKGMKRDFRKEAGKLVAEEMTQRLGRKVSRVAVDSAARNYREEGRRRTRDAAR